MNNDTLIQFEEITLEDRPFDVWILPSEVCVITGDMTRQSSGTTMIHMKNGEAFLVEGDEIQIIKKLGLDYN
jgi:hypothetical protein